ncbi:hypothetical protein PAESOLCIP111_04279 [Paenibacillus solanacearum]|uniref:Carboxymuconolactone decarboxylase-like domain-containing protein n=1 Tax=Paenibacillus solanacearum TaxID=2048548 RepID=A0A916K718_9BACL|nr:carboxymuconolactone decarboxylase family protein [Paenibacillus solanacearum]CAG7641875.1 hypothetical protein PAESOLCIP111_04279 [Paenibacillus solanacearum]
MSHYYNQADLEWIPELVKLAPQASASFFAFEKEVYHSDGALPLKTKELLAVAAAHLTGCPYCIDVHVQKYRKLGGTREEIVEAVLVAASTQAGAVLSHATQALAAFHRAASAEGSTSGDEHRNRNGDGDRSGPACFC